MKSQWRVRSYTKEVFRRGLASFDTHAAVFKVEKVPPSIRASPHLGSVEDEVDELQRQASRVEERLPHHHNLSGRIVIVAVACGGGALADPLGTVGVLTRGEVVGSWSFPHCEEECLAAWGSNKSGMVKSIDLLERATWAGV